MAAFLRRPLSRPAAEPAGADAVGAVPGGSAPGTARPPDPAAGKPQMRRPAPLQHLLAAALRDGAGHVGQVLQLARIETDANLRAWLRLVGIVGTIPILAIATFFLGLDALVKIIAALSGAPLTSAAIVAAPFVAITLVLVRLGTRRLALANLEPWRSWRRSGRSPR